MAEIQVPIGPQHPALEEPELFLLTVDGEQIVDAEMRIGYNHRGMEKSAEYRNMIQVMYLYERICGICSHSHSTTFIRAVEEIAGLEIPKRADWIRTLVAELERIHSHLLWLGIAGHEIGFDTLWMYSWRDRELVQDILEEICGNRVNYGINTLGGVRRDICPEKIDDYLKALDILEERTAYYAKVAFDEGTLAARLSGVHVLPKEKAIELCACGPMGRASGVESDVRAEEPYMAYPELPFKVITYHTGDIFGRAVVRILEVIEAVKMCRHILQNLPPGEVRLEKVPKKIPEGEAFVRYEAPRGEDVHYVRANGTEMPDRAKVRAPTMQNLPATMWSLKGSYIADAPIAIASIDPCFSCTDRMALVRDLRSGKETKIRFKDLGKLAKEGK